MVRPLVVAWAAPVAAQTSAAHSAKSDGKVRTSARRRSARGRKYTRITYASLHDVIGRKKRRRILAQARVRIARGNEITAAPPVGLTVDSAPVRARSSCVPAVCDGLVLSAVLALLRCAQRCASACSTSKTRHREHRK